jgi:hypothetical protein
MTSSCGNIRAWLSTEMGRLGPLNSLAFGRSPFQPPELDENGDFILGPHAHEFDNKDFYVQKFDERGHPKNDASKATIQEMQHAQNAVLETVGVVVRREEAAKSAWQRQSKRDKVTDIINENNYGIVMREVLPFLVQSSVWWGLCLRRRMQTFRPYLDPPVTNIIRSEVQRFGPLSFLTDGLLSSIAAYILNILLMSLQSQRSELTLEISSGDASYTWKPFKSFAVGLAIPLLVFPAKAFAVLQGLHLIPSTSHLNPRCFVPFTAASPIQMPSTPAVWSIGTGLAFATSICYHPFVLGTISDKTKAYIHNAMYRVVLLTLTPRPDHPDKLTIEAARRTREDEDGLDLPGIGRQNNTERLSRGRTIDFWTEIGRELGFIAARIYQWKNIITRQKRSKEVENEHQSIPVGLADRTRALQRQMVRDDLENLRANEEDRLRVQRQAHNWALAEFGLYSGGDVDEWLLPAHEIFDADPLDTRSTPTPEPVDLTDHAADQAQDLEPPTPIFDPFTPDNEHDREEREGEGRMMASLGFDDSDATLEGPFQNPLYEPNQGESGTSSPVFFRDLGAEHSPPELRNPFETASDPSREAILEEATHVVTDVPVRRNARLFDGPAYYDPNDIIQESIPEAPDSPLDRNATPPAISLNRDRDRDDDRRSSPRMVARPTPSPSLSEASMSSHELASRRLRRRLDLRLRPPISALPYRDRDLYDDDGPRQAPSRRAPSDLDLHWPSRSSSSSDDGAAHNTRPESGPSHRVTTLSVFPAEMFAECAAGLFTSAITLPLDSLYVRSLASGFLGAAAPGASAAALGIKGDVYGMGEWFGGSAGGWTGRVRYAGMMALMMGIQGCVSSVSWALVTRLAIVIGRQKGWGAV